MRSAAVVLVILLLAGCDAETPRSTPTPDGTNAVAIVDPEDPCALLSRAEVADATGQDVAPGREQESRPGPRGSQPLCIYRTGRPYASIVIYVETPLDGRDFRRELRRDPRNTKPIDGLGDLAYIHAGVSLSLLVDDVAVRASVQHFDSVEKTEVVLRAIGAAVVDRLQTT